MKTYTHAKVGLFIGLLSFNTLSACVNTRKELGSCECLSYGQKRWLNKDDSKNKKRVIGGGVALTALIGSIGTWAVIHHSGNQSGIANTTNGNNARPLPWCKDNDNNNGDAATIYNMTLEQEQRMLQTINMTSKEWAAQWKPSDRVKDPMVLNGEIVQDIKNSSFSLESISRWLLRCLHINAKDEENCTLLGMATKSNETEASKFLLDQEGVDTNAPC